MNKILKRAIIFIGILVLGLISLAAEKYPTRPINDIVFSSAGGGTDIVNRYLATAIEKILGQKIIVSNMPGGLGGTAAEYVWQQKHDGYTLLGVSETATTFLVNDATSHGVKDWIFFIAAGSPGVIAVRSDSPYHSIDELLKATANNPKTLKIANSGTGKLWHIKAVILERNAGVQFLHVPYNGSAPAILSVLSGETDAVSAALGEVSEHVRAGKMRILLITEDRRVDAPELNVTNVPAITERFPKVKKYFPLQQWLAFAVPKDTPRSVVNILGDAFDKVMESPETEAFNKQQYLTKIALWGWKANSFAYKMEQNISWISKELGVAKIDPASLGIPKPSWAQ